jgi:hypothetical protein
MKEYQQLLDNKQQVLDWLGELWSTTESTSTHSPEALQRLF